MRFYDVVSVYSLMSPDTVPPSSDAARPSTPELREALEQAEEYRRLLDTAAVLAAIGDFDGRFLMVNAAWRDLLGYSPDRLVGTEYLKLVHPDDLERAALALGDLMSGTTLSRTLDLRVRARDGSFRWLSCHVRADHERRRLYGIGQDITDRRLMEDALRVTGERLERLASKVSQQVHTPSADGLHAIAREILEIAAIEVSRARDPQVPEPE